MKRRLATLPVAAAVFACVVLAAPYASAAIGKSASVRTYLNQAIPVSAASPNSEGTPLSAGQMTLEEVLESHPIPKKPSLQPPSLAPGSVPANSVSAPVMAPSSQASTESDMLMQGMKSVLQQSGTDITPPQLPGAAAAAPAAETAAAPPIPLVPKPVPAPTNGVKYQPGQEPKDLAPGVSLPAQAATPAEPSTAEAPAQSPAAPGETATPGCEPHTEKWTKTCAEAGYPDNFTGQVSGETHTACPAGNLQDVWISNTCAAPEGSSETEAAAPLSAPSPMQPEPMAAASPGISQADGSCGPANGLATATKPDPGNLCMSGTASDVAGDGPWRWNCAGSASGMTVSCAAPVAEASSPPPAPVAAAPAASEETAETPAAVAAEDGQCGSANGAGTEQAPSAELCAKGIPSRVNGTGPWTWACSGRNGGQAVACFAAHKVDGACGSANGSGTGTGGMPMTDLCAAGYASAITGDGPWNWTCSGLYGGQAALCSAAPKKDAVCGQASLYGHREAPQTDLCSVGQPSSVNGGGPWTWTCNGANGGSSVPCTSPVSQSGSCGKANGVAAASAPKDDDLCSYGKATRVSGSGPWTWTCSGTDGGESESCTAPLSPGAAPSAAPAAHEETASAPAAPAEAPAKAASTGEEKYVSCGTAADFAAFEAPAKELCKKGEAGEVTGSGPWSWTCSDKSGHKAECATPSPAGSASKPGEMPAPKAAPATPVTASEPVAACGSAANQGTASAPKSGLCSTGKASKVSGEGPWNWTCAKGKGKVQCEAPKLVDGACGSANGTTFKTPPTADLCSAGNATGVQGNGPWMWSCVGTGGGVSVSCSAAAQSRTRVDGACGAAASNTSLSAPTTGLCDGGMPSAVNGTGPWTWTCSGLNGGIASLCSTQRNAPHAPPPPGPAVNGLCGDSNGVAFASQPEDGLCSAGTVTPVSGNGPWNWSCIGVNGGMTVSCTAPLQPPAPITGVCGSATGVPTLTTPQSGLCAAGISSAVSGRGPWTWSCSGTNGGGAVACVAPLAGSGGGPLPSLVTPSEAPAPQAAASTPVTSSGLVTPRLPTKDLAPLPPSAISPLVPSKPFDVPPEPSALPPVPAPNATPEAPAAAPDVPAGTETLTPPPVSSTIKSSPALKSSVGKVIPGNHVTLPDDLSTVPFTQGAENISTDALPTLDKLAAILQANAGLRITLTSYAGVTENISPRDARRLSLTRALAIRDYLTAKGLSSSRIDVRALGANVPSGDPDRVDIKTE